jgi:hypothetical protein
MSHGNSENRRKEKVNLFKLGTMQRWCTGGVHSLTSALDGGEWSASLPVRFTPRERNPGTHWIGGWVDPRAGLNMVAKGKIPSPC